MFTYTYIDELGNEVTIRVPDEVHQIVQDEHKFDDRLKAEYKRHITDLPDDRLAALPSTENVEDIALVRESLRDVFELVNGCTEKQRRRFLLYIVYGLTMREIAEMEGCSFQRIQQSVQAVTRNIMNNL